MIVTVKTYSCMRTKYHLSGHNTWQKRVFYCSMNCRRKSHTTADQLGLGHLDVRLRREVPREIHHPAINPGPRRCWGKGGPDCLPREPDERLGLPSSNGGQAYRSLGRAVSHRHRIPGHELDRWGQEILSKQWTGKCPLVKDTLHWICWRHRLGVQRESHRQSPTNAQLCFSAHQEEGLGSIADPEDILPTRLLMKLAEFLRGCGVDDPTRRPAVSGPTHGAVHEMCGSWRPRGPVFEVGRVEVGADSKRECRSSSPQWWACQQMAKHLHKPGESLTLCYFVGVKMLDCI